MNLTNRPRRLRRTKEVRRLCRETRLSPDSLIYPIFVDETLQGTRPIPSLPGQFHYGLDSVCQAVEEALKTKPPLAAIDAIALVESGLSRLCDVTVAVTAPEAVRVARLMVRDRIPESYARARIAAQPSEDFFRTHCDYVLENNGTAQEFREKCLAFFSGLVIMKP